MGGTGQALVRMSWAKLAVSTAKRMPDGANVLGALGGLRDEVRDAGILEWRPIHNFVSVAEAIAGALGHKGARDFWRDVLLAAFDRRLLAPLVRGALALHGRTPRSILRMTPQAYTLTFKNCGRATLHDTGDDKQVRLQFDELPPALHLSPAAMDAFAGNCDAAIQYVSWRGRVVRYDDDLARGRLHYLVGWD
jgi:hypothetical protein